MEAFIKQIAPIVQKYAREFEFGVPSAVIAQACLESAYGTSTKAKRNNLFGMKYREGRVSCHSGTFFDGSREEVNGRSVPITAQWYAFDTIDEGIKGYFQFIQNGPYGPAREVSQTDHKAYLTALKRCGYATSSYYVNNNENVIAKWDLTKYDGQEKKEAIATYNFHELCNARSVSYGRTRSASEIKYIVLHYTGNANDTAKANCNFFATSNTRAAGAHYFVDENDVYQSIADNLSAWSVGGAKYANCTTTGGGKYYGKCTNFNSISIEMCSRNGEIPERTVRNAAELTKKLMEKYNIPSDHVIRHFDVTGKNCPGWAGWTGEKWTDFKDRLGDQTKKEEKPFCSIGKITARCDVNIRQWPDTKSHVWDVLKAGETMEVMYIWNGSHAAVTINGNTGFVSLDYVILKNYFVLTNPRKALVNCPGDVLNVRTYRSTSYPVIGTLEHQTPVTYYDGRIDEDGMLWILIGYASGYGFVRADFLKM